MKLAGVAGWPVSHSRSPKLHGFWLKEYHIDGAYVPLPIAPENLTEALTLLPKIGFSGINLTVPHKETTFHHCMELGIVDGEAQKIGAVNTLMFAEGRIVNATNTDGFGFIQNLKAGVPEWQPKTTHALVLGAGGAARGIIAALLNAGVSSITILNRTRKKAVVLANDFSNITVGNWEKPAEALSTTNLLINTTSLGMNGGTTLDLKLDALSKNAIVTDIVYTPLHTDLLQNAQARGNKTVDGLGMLLHQAVPGFEAWFGIKPEVTQALRTHMLEA